MSRRHSAHAGDVTHIVNDINDMSPEEAENIYGIQFLEQGRIYDTMYNREFGSLGEWAEFNVQQDEMEFEEDIGREHREPWE